MERFVSVCARWGDYVLSVRDLRRGESLSVGSPPARLLSFRASTPSVHTLQGDRELGPGESVTVHRDGLDFTLSCTELEEGPSFAPKRRELAVWDALALLLVFVAIGGRWVPATGSSTSVPQGLTAAARRARPPPEELRITHPALFAVVAAPVAEPREQPGDTRCGAADPGVTHNVDGRGRWGTRGPVDNADPHLARPVFEEGFPTAHGAWAPLGVPQSQPGSASPTAPFGRDSALGTDLENAQGKFWGDELARETGEDGLGFARREGGVAKAFDVAPLADVAPSELRVLHTGLRVSGARKTSEVARALAAHFDDFRACAEGAVLPELVALQLELDVAADGGVSATSQGAAALEPCLSQSLGRVSFAAGAEGTTHVVYPLYFSRASTPLQRPEFAQPPAPCNCPN